MVNFSKGFGSDIRAILRSAVKRHATTSSTGTTTTTTSSSGSSNSIGGGSSTSTSTGTTTGTSSPPALAPAQLIMSTATLTKAVRALLQDVQGNKGSGFLIDYNDPTNLTPKVRK